MGFNQFFLPLFLQMVILVELLPSSTPILASPSFPIAKPHCHDRCGDLSIPFPFGTQEGCYLNEDFFINCTNSFDANAPPQPLLRGSDIEVINISSEGQLRLLNIVGSDFYNQEGSLDRDMSFDTWMMLDKGLAFNGTANKFTTVGCDTYSRVQGYTVDGILYRTGCESFCVQKKDVKDNSSCAGIGCCQISIPPGALSIDVSSNSYKNHTRVWNFNPCSYAFLVEDGAFRLFADNLTNIKNVPVVVDWTIDNITCEDAQKNTTSYACSSTNVTPHNKWCFPSRQDYL